MRVRMLTTQVAYFDGLIQRAFAGQEYDLPAEIARNFVDHGLAHETENEPNQKTDKALKPKPLRRKNGRS